MINQVVGSSGPIGSNYREANDSLGTKDFLQKLKISRREAKETIHWLKLLSTANKHKAEEIHPLITESTELKKILSVTINKF